MRPVPVVIDPTGTDLTRRFSNSRGARPRPQVWFSRQIGTHSHARAFAAIIALGMIVLLLCGTMLGASKPVSGSRVATDASSGRGAPSRSRATQVLFFDDFENEYTLQNSSAWKDHFGGWTTDNVDTDPTGVPYTGTNGYLSESGMTNGYGYPQDGNGNYQACYDTSYNYIGDYDGFYYNDAGAGIETEWLDLSDALSAELTFDHRYAIITGGSDAGQVYINDDHPSGDPSHWASLTPVTGYPTGQGYQGSQENWARQRFELDAYVGKTVKIAWIFVSDTDGYVADGWHLDNVKVTVERPNPRCDLTVTSVDLESGGASITETTAGERVNITAGIQNIGDVDCAESITVRFFDGDPSSGGTLIGSGTIAGGLAVMAERAVTTDWTASEGDHQIYVVVDPDGAIDEGNEYNNVAIGSLDVAEVQIPDLVVNQIFFYHNGQPVTFPNTGDQITISADIRNLGSADVTDEILVEFYDGNPSTGGALIGSDTLSGLAAQSLRAAETVWVCTDGSHRIYASIDPTGAIDEANTFNNIDSARLTVTTERYPDLAVTAVQFHAGDPPATVIEVYTDELVTVVATVENTGDVEITETVTVGFYDGDPDLSGERLGSMVLGEPLAVNATAEVLFEWVAERGVDAIYVKIDVEDLIAEAVEANNIASARIAVEDPPRPDLTIRSLTLIVDGEPNATAEAQQLVTARCSLANIGAVPVEDAIVVALYRGDPKDGGVLITTTTIAGGLASEAQTTVEIVWHAQRGEHLIYIVADPEDAIEEQYVLNNNKYTQLTVTERVKRADLTAVSLSVYRGEREVETALRGDTLTLKGAVQNRGERAVEDELPVQFWAGRPGETGAYKLGTKALEDGLDVEEYDFLELEFETADLAFGRHEYYVKIDPTDLVKESNETNNLVGVEIQITGAPALSIQNVTVRYASAGAASAPIATAVVGENITITVTVQNTGTKELPAESGLRVTVFQGAGHDRREVGSKPVGSIAAGRHAAIQIDHTLEIGAEGIAVELAGNGSVLAEPLSATCALEVEDAPESLEREGDQRALAGFDIWEWWWLLLVILVVIVILLIILVVLRRRTVAGVIERPDPELKDIAYEEGDEEGDGEGETDGAVETDQPQRLEQPPADGYGDGYGYGYGYGDGYGDGGAGFRSYPYDGGYSRGGSGGSMPSQSSAGAMGPGQMSHEQPYYQPQPSSGAASAPPRQERRAPEECQKCGEPLKPDMTECPICGYRFFDLF